LRASGEWPGVAAFLSQCESIEMQTLITGAVAEDKLIPNATQQVGDILLRLRNQFVDRQLSVLTQRAGQPELTDAERTRMRRAKIGFIFQRFNLLPTLSAMGNIEIAHDIATLGVSTKRELDRPLLDHLTEMLGIKGRLDHRPNELSGGEQQRVAIARALINRPAIVLADEPTGNLDTKNSDAVLQMLRKSSRELNQTVLMITHNPEAAAIADRIIHMRDGQIRGIEPGKGSVVHQDW